MLVESDGEKLYKLVSESEIDNTISEYHKQRSTVLPSRPVNERANPFSSGIMEDKDDDEVVLQYERIGWSSQKAANIYV
ncbi:hypothetical protein OESDEN_02226 [Oesophagostomum dentatum]|uniref:Uncharacterized protein n=1 Tax=Oesophagostomum dentatum TaxID=61180 RepID=A0A0B1TNV9_OESDE|nr:hypothetical protein OESDEN_02226 [Oesophagostomum dentatum]